MANGVTDGDELWSVKVFGRIGPRQDLWTIHSEKQDIAKPPKVKLSKPYNASGHYQ